MVDPEECVLVPLGWFGSTRLKEKHLSLQLEGEVMAIMVVMVMVMGDG